MATYPSDKQSLSGAIKEKETSLVLPADQDLENGDVDTERRAREVVDRPSPRSVHGISVRRAFFRLSVLATDTYGYFSGYSSWLALCPLYYCTLLTTPSWPTSYR